MITSQSIVDLTLTVQNNGDEAVRFHDAILVSKSTSYLAHSDNEEGEPTEAINPGASRLVDFSWDLGGPASDKLGRSLVITWRFERSGKELQVHYQAYRE